MDENKFFNLLITLIDEIDPYKSGHSEKVNKMSELIGLKLALDEEDISLLKIGSMLHDIGKILLPTDLWVIPKKVDDEDREIMQKHPVMGANLLTKCNFDKEIINIVKYHHEWWDGGGYPEGLRGENIPLKARIVGLAEAYVSMVSYDVYSHSLEKEEAIEIIKNNKGIQFSPEIVDVFLEMMNN